MVRQQKKDLNCYQIRVYNYDIRVCEIRDIVVWFG